MARKNQNIKNQFDRAILPLAKDNVVVYEALKSLGTIVQDIEDELHPLVAVTSNALQADPIPQQPTFGSITIFPDYVRLTWVPLDTASRSYEIRKGLDWDTAEFVLRTSSTVAQLNPLVGVAPIVHQFMIKSINNSGVYSTTPAIAAVALPTPLTPVITATVIDNNVLLRWTNSFATNGHRISHYIISKNGSEYGTTTGNFIAIFETISGDYEYQVVGVDIAGNQSLPGIVQVHVNQPPDFELFSTWQSIFAVIDPPPTGDFEIQAVAFNNTHRVDEAGLLRLLGPVDSSETWQEHYVNNAWASPQAQVTAGFPIYIQPGEVLGDYIEEIDYGAVINNVIVNVDWTEVIIAGSVAITIEISTSLDGSSWSAYSAGSSQFVPTFRYLRVKVVFTGGSGAIKEVSHLTINLDVKREVDSGEVVASASDVGGTVVLFTKVFKDIDSITLTVKSLEQVTALYDFVDVPNPTQFKILAFDGAGNRITYPVSWKARGIV